MTVWYNVTIWRRESSQHGDEAPSSSSSHTLQAKHTRQAMAPTLPSPGRGGSGVLSIQEARWSMGASRQLREGPVGLGGPAAQGAQHGGWPHMRLYEGGQPLTVWKLHRQAFRRNLGVQGKAQRRTGGGVALPWPLWPHTCPGATEPGCSPFDSDPPGITED